MDEASAGQVASRDTKISVPSSSISSNKPTKQQNKERIYHQGWDYCFWWRRGYWKDSFFSPRLFFHLTLLPPWPHLWTPLQGTSRIMRPQQLPTYKFLPFYRSNLYLGSRKWRRAWEQQRWVAIFGTMSSFLELGLVRLPHISTSELTSQILWRPLGGRSSFVNLYPRRDWRRHPSLIVLTG